MRTILDDIALDDVSVSRDTTFADAAELLVESRAAMLAVLDEDRRVVGLFGAEQAVAGVLPGYLGELQHTAFTSEDSDLLAETAAAIRNEPVEKHAAEPVTVAIDASALHVGEVFLHTDHPAVAVVEEGRFVGMLDEAEFARAMLRRGSRPDA